METIQLAGNGKHDKCVGFCCAYEAETECLDCDRNRRLRGQKGEMDDGRRSSAGDSEAAVQLWLAADTVQVVHGSVEGELHSFSVGGAASLL